MLMRPSVITFLCALSLSASACASVAPVDVDNDFQVWVSNLKIEMHKKGISQETLDKVYAKMDYQPNSKVIKQDRKQLEFVLTSTEYINRLVVKSRVEKGQQYYQELAYIDELTKVVNRRGFYEEIVKRYKEHKAKRKNEVKKELKLIKFKVRKYSILSFFTFGKKHKYYHDKLVDNKRYLDYLLQENN